MNGERVGGEKLWTNLKQFSFLGQLELGAETQVKVSLLLVYGLSKKKQYIVLTGAEKLVNHCVDLILQDKNNLR